MIKRILVFALVSAVLVQSRSTSKLTEEGHAEGGKEHGSVIGGLGKDLKDSLAKAKSSLKRFFNKLHEAAGNAVDENAANLDREIDSILAVGNATVNAGKTIIDAKIKLIKSIPKAIGEALKELKVK